MPKIDENYFKVENPMKQNAVEDILEKDEKILQRLKPNAKVIRLEAIFKGMPLALLWFSIDAIFIVTMFATGAVEEAPWMIAFMIGFFALHLLPVWLYIANLIKKLAGYKNIEYVFTDKRIIIRSGLVGIDFKSIYYTSLESVNLKVGLFDRLFKVGDIYLKANTQTAVLEDIENPYVYLSKLQKIALDIKSDIYYPNDLRPSENHGYQTEYKGGEE